MNAFVLPILLFVSLVASASARPGPIDKDTKKLRTDLTASARFVEVQHLEWIAETYRVLATKPLDEALSRELIPHFRGLPFERVTHGQCHEPGFALRMLDADRKLIAEITFCWRCHNLQATPNSTEAFREYREDFSADTKRGKAFQTYLQTFFPTPK